MITKKVNICGGCKMNTLHDIMLMLHCMTLYVALHLSSPLNVHQD